MFCFFFFMRRRWLTCWWGRSGAWRSPSTNWKPWPPNTLTPWTWTLQPAHIHSVSFPDNSAEWMCKRKSLNIYISSSRTDEEDNKVKPQRRRHFYHYDALTLKSKYARWAWSDSGLSRKIPDCGRPHASLLVPAKHFRHQINLAPATRTHSDTPSGDVSERA